MKKLLANVLRLTLRNDSVNALFEKALGWPVDYARIIRREYVKEHAFHTTPELGFIRSKIPDLVVRSGPFRGMRYPSAAAVGSTLVPKLLGTYEAELHSTVEEICGEKYQTIVDIGSAEGYYAVGLALRFPDAAIFAYDIEPEAIRLCRAMAEVNGVSNRLLTGALCTSSTLKHLPYGKRSLIVCDCEGFEAELFPEEVIQSLVQHDLLIELHDFIDSRISSAIRERFSATHSIRSVRSVSDSDKARTYHCEELDGLRLELKEFLLAERRPCAMEWFFLRAKQSSLE